MMEFIFLILYFLTYIIFFQLKSLRDYTMYYKYDFPERWNTSIWKSLPDWFEGYLVDDAQLFIESNPPKLIKWMMWDEKNARFRLSYLDGWHQADGFIFMEPQSLIVMLIGYYILNLNIFISFFISLILSYIWYEYFNWIFHIQHRIRGYKEYNRIWWLKRFFVKNEELK